MAEWVGLRCSSKQEAGCWWAGRSSVAMEMKVERREVEVKRRTRK